MDGVPYPQPLTGHEPQYVPWEVLLVRPIGHPPQAGATSGRWPTVPGVTHLTACAQVGPIQTPGGGQTPEVGYLTSVFCGLLSPRPPPRSLRCWSLPPSFLPQGCPPFPRPLPCFLAPAVSRLPLLSIPARARWCPLFFFLAPPPLATRLSPRRFGLSSAPPPMSPRRVLAVLALFLGGWGRRGWGGGASSLSVLWRKHVASTAQARGASLVPLQVGGGRSPCGSRRRPSYPAFAPPVPPPLGLARRVLPTGTVVWSVPHPLSAASPPCRFVLGGGGGRCPPLPTFTPHPWGGGGVWGGGGLVVFPSLHACRRHDASTAQA